MWDRFGSLWSQGKIREICTTIQKYEWVSNDTKLNSNEWRFPLMSQAIVPLSWLYNDVHLTLNAHIRLESRPPSGLSLNHFTTEEPPLSERPFVLEGRALCGARFTFHLWFYFLPSARHLPEPIRSRHQGQWEARASDPGLLSYLLTILLYASQCPTKC